MKNSNLFKNSKNTQKKKNGEDEKMDDSDDTGVRKVKGLAIDINLKEYQQVL